MAGKAGNNTGVKVCFLFSPSWKNSTPKTLRQSNLKVSIESYRSFCTIFCVLEVNIQGDPEKIWTIEPKGKLS